MPELFPIPETLRKFDLCDIFQFPQRWIFNLIFNYKKTALCGSLYLKYARASIDVGTSFGQNEEAMKCEQVYYRDAKGMNCFTLYFGCFLGLLHANILNLQIVDLLVIDRLILWQKPMGYYEVKITIREIIKLLLRFKHIYFLNREMHLTEQFN